jgi:hypothetical protein
MDDTRRLWAAAIFPWAAEIFCGMWDTDRFYQTRAEAILDVGGHAIRLKWGYCLLAGRRPTRN